MARGPRASLVAIGFSVTGLLLLGPVLIALGPHTLVLSMGGAVLTVIGVLAAVLLLVRLPRGGGRE